MKIDAIFTGDWHLREKPPTNRIDDFYKVQWEKVSFIAQLQKKHKCPIIHSGDLFDTWKPSPMLLANTLKYLPDNFYTIYGNHDLPQHNLELQYKTGISVLQNAGKIKVLEGTHWGQVPTQETINIKGRSILVWHVMTYQGKKPWHDCTDPKSIKLLRKYRNYDVIVTGHNHLTFTEEYKDRLLVNPGSIFRMNITQERHKPCVFLYNAEENKVLAEYIPIKDNVFDKKSLIRKEQKMNRIDAFIEKLGQSLDNEISFEKNIEIYIRNTSINQSVKDILLKSLQK